MQCGGLRGLHATMVSSTPKTSFLGFDTLPVDCFEEVTSAVGSNPFHCVLKSQGSVVRSALGVRATLLSAQKRTAVLHSSPLGPRRRLAPASLFGPRREVMHRVRTVATISGQTPVKHPKMYPPKQPIEPQKTLVASKPPVFLAFFRGCR